MQTVNVTFQKTKALRQANIAIMAQQETSQEPSPEKVLKDYIKWQYDNIERLVAHAIGKTQLETHHALARPYDKRTQGDDALFLATFQNIRGQIIKARKELAQIKGVAR
jgi:hypothetical protein